jgi:hypothetical protein
MRSKRVPVLISGSLVAIGLAACQVATHDFRDAFPPGTCVDLSSDGDNETWVKKDCARPHEYVVTAVLEHTTDRVLEHDERCNEGERAVEVAEIPYGAIVCLRASV